MAVIEKERTARKQHRCERCLGRIAPGERYLDSRLPPHYDVNSSDHWWRVKVHISIDTCYPPRPTEETGDTPRPPANRN